MVTAAAFALAYHFVQPAPPRHIVMTTGSKDGAYYYYGRIYRDLLAKEGIDVTLEESPGPVANIARLQEGQADVGFVQGGTRTDGGDTPLRSLASLYYEPVWIFVPDGSRIERLSRSARPPRRGRCRGQRHAPRRAAVAG